MCCLSQIVGGIPLVGFPGVPGGAPIGRDRGEELTNGAKQ